MPAAAPLRWTGKDDCSICPGRKCLLCISMGGYTSSLCRVCKWDSGMRPPSHRVLHHLPMRNKKNGPFVVFFRFSLLICDCANLSEPMGCLRQSVCAPLVLFPDLLSFYSYHILLVNGVYMDILGIHIHFFPSNLHVWSSFPLPSFLLPSSFPSDPSFFLMNSTTPWTITEFLAKYLRRTYDEYDFLGFFGVVFLVKTFCRCKLIYHDGELFFPVSLLQLLVVDRSKALKRPLMKINVCFWLVWAPRCSSQAYM